MVMMGAPLQQQQTNDGFANDVQYDTQMARNMEAISKSTKVAKAQEVAATGV